MWMIARKMSLLQKKIHIDVSHVIAQTASQINSKMVHISTDHLWDGTMQMVTEDVPVCPVNIYGKTKAESERAVLAVNSEALILRTNFFWTWFTMETIVIRLDYQFT